MTRPELDRMLEKAVADAIGVAYRSQPARQSNKRLLPAGGRPVQPQHIGRELQHA